MKSIKLREGVEMMAGNQKETDVFLFKLLLPHDIDHSTYIPLGTSTEFLSRPDAEERCKEWVDNSFLFDSYRDYTKEYKDINGDSKKVMDCDTATDSFQSALTAMGYEDGEILIVKITKG